jgi:sRNA-binding protein
MYLHQQDRDTVIGYLADRFPSCFFENPELRRPLKHDIIDDLEKERVLERNKLAQALDWYQNHFAYRRAVVAGAERVGLSGQRAGIVTPQEQQENRRWIAERKKEMAEQKAIRESAEPPRVVVKPPVTKEPGHEAVMTNKIPPPPNLHPSLAGLQEALVVVNGLLTDRQFESMRPILATAALKEVISDAEALIVLLQGPGVQP